MSLRRVEMEVKPGIRESVGGFVRGIITREKPQLPPQTQIDQYRQTLRAAGVPPEAAKQAVTVFAFSLLDQPMTVSLSVNASKVYEEARLLKLAAETARTRREVEALAALTRKPKVGFFGGGKTIFTQLQKEVESHKNWNVIAPHRSANEEVAHS